ncbi:MULTISPECIES: glycoside hydrolase family 3 N-terminal domain-containing protein [unclassified Vibrio]|uniref:Glycoside hydrolase family 3 N-terminal domain-containing protein n=1 Tax=Vibrio sp. HB236076 TaxID=3232307 RepID=A0AB39HJP2_9VIBR|nr:glycoside hydrolase family 3 protein [Vibrio sp. HB161653]MDP5252726.1 glycoside hydrolase family 3 N-terminal domain-containing protein [Vibrio sp. HB161653]
MEQNRFLFAQQAIAPLSRQAAAEGMVLLKNTDGVLPCSPDQRVSVFGRCQLDTYRSGTGSGGAVNVPYAVNIIDGLRQQPGLTLNQPLASLYQDWVAENPFDDGGGGWATEPWFQKEMPIDSDLLRRYCHSQDVAIVVIGRTAGEDQDNQAKAGSYFLTDTEQGLLTQCCQFFQQVVVVLNVTNIIDMSWLTSTPHHETIKAVLYSWAAGMEGGHALADVLSGQVCPSAKLCDTIAYQLSDYPSDPHFGGIKANQYGEDIYVGYRYFETFAPDRVQFEFGFGLSYTDFTTQLSGFRTEGQGRDEVLHFDIAVRNNGDTFTGKEVVQLYCQAPQGQLGKPARVLVAFQKTANIAPGGEQSLSLSVPVSSLASYDDSGVSGHRFCEVLEAGEYRFYLGNSVKQASLLPSCWSLSSTLVVDKKQSAMAPLVAFERLRPGEELSDRTYNARYEPVPTRQYCLEKRIKRALPPALSITGERGIRLADVRDGHAELTDFVAQMSKEQLATLVRGEGMCSPKVTPGTAATFGGVSDSLFDLGIPLVCCSDGPSGIRLDSGHKATQVPIGTLLSCTWNPELNQALYRALGQEMQAYQIDNLLGPGINLHRHPLNGRNFEYFSEDPFLTGAIAIAQIQGLDSAGVTATVKHFCANDQETKRHDVESQLSERALRELHLKPFEMAVKQGKVRSIMTAYNPVNHYWSASHYDLTTHILRHEWQFDGIVMSDWWAKMNHPVDGGEAALSNTAHMVRAQNDLYMVVENDRAEQNPMNDNTLSGLEQGQLTLGELQRSAINICRFILTTPAMQRPLVRYQPVKHFVASEETNFTPEVCINHHQGEVTRSQSSHQRIRLRVEQAGQYKIVAKVVYSRDALAQSACSVSFNGHYAMSVMTNGTQGKPVDIEGITVSLEPGGYTVELEWFKPGLVIECLSLVKQ